MIKSEEGYRSCGKERHKRFCFENCSKIQAKKVILFGSFAYGKPVKGSDVDILVIMDTSLRSVEQAIEIRKTVGTFFPLDLIVRTPKQIEDRLSKGDFFIREILDKGEILYEVPD